MQYIPERKQFISHNVKIDIWSAITKNRSSVIDLLSPIAGKKIVTTPGRGRNEK